jgi:hypothetical protein
LHFSLWRYYFRIQVRHFSPAMVEKFPFIFQSFIDSNPIQLHSNWIFKISQFDSILLFS